MAAISLPGPAEPGYLSTNYVLIPDLNESRFMTVFLCQSLISRGILHTAIVNGLFMTMTPQLHFN